MAKAVRRTNSRSSAANSGIRSRQTLASLLQPSFAKEIGDAVDDLPAVEVCGPRPRSLRRQTFRLRGKGGQQARLADAALPEFEGAAVVALDLPADGAQHGFIVIATQGRGDGAALKAVLGAQSRYTGFVGSRKKFAALRCDLEADGLDVRSMDDMRSPAGLDLGSITPDEIAFSIVAEMIEIRRRGQRNT